MRKPEYCLCENKGADQLCSNCTADQHLYFRYTNSTIPPIRIGTQNFMILPSSVTVQAGFCRTNLETTKTGFLASRLKVYFEKKKQ